MALNRSAIFIDGAWLEYLVNKQFDQAPIDFSRLVQALVPPPTTLLRAFYYHSLPYVDDDVEEKVWNMYEGRRRFFHALNLKGGLTVREGRVSRRIDNAGEPFYEQQLTDVLFVVDLLNLAYKGQIDHAVIVSNDSDFIPAVQAAQHEGVRVLVWGPDGQASRLQVIADECYTVDQGLIDLCLLSDEERSRRDPSPGDPRDNDAPRPLAVPGRAPRQGGERDPWGE